VLGLTRAWTLVRFFESRMFEMSECTRCSGHFVMHAHTPNKDYVCGICQPPSRAGKTAQSVLDRQLANCRSA
jgi:flagellar transcriptional activator FlhC